MTSFPSLEVYDDSVPRSAAVNMALDERLWVTAIMPRIRFYRWDHSALSFGYFGRYQDVAHYHNERELVRRCTGGGVVFHGKDLTYALIVPSSCHLAETSPMVVYAFVHQAIQRALSDDGIVAVLASSACRASVSDATSLPFRTDGLQSPNGKATYQEVANACFSNPVPADVLVNGKKVAGAAQRRSHRGLLHQGSIQNVEVAGDFGQKLVRGLSAKPLARQIDERLLLEAEELSQEKYAAKAWLQRR